jgi:hypothetical protein
MARSPIQESNTASIACRSCSRGSAGKSYSAWKRRVSSRSASASSSVSAYGATEPDAGSDLPALKTTARPVIPTRAGRQGVRPVVPAALPETKDRETLGHLDDGRAARGPHRV